MSTKPIAVIWGGVRFPSTNSVAVSCGGSAGAVRKALATSGLYRGKPIKLAEITA